MGFLLDNRTPWVFVGSLALCHSCHSAHTHKIVNLRITPEHVFLAFVITACILCIQCLLTICDTFSSCCVAGSIAVKLPWKVALGDTEKPSFGKVVRVKEPQVVVKVSARAALRR